MKEHLVILNGNYGNIDIIELTEELNKEIDKLGVESFLIKKGYDIGIISFSFMAGKISVNNITL